MLVDMYLETVCTAVRLNSDRTVIVHGEPFNR